VSRPREANLRLGGHGHRPNSALSRTRVLICSAAQPRAEPQASRARDMTRSTAEQM
jgi:hypothetical protein